MALADDLLAVLDNPTHMWAHALRELSSDAQRLFLTLTLLPKPVSSDVLQVAYTSQKCERSESFLDSLRSLEDSFITIEKRYADLRAVTFRNPSLQDFANAYLDENSDWLDILLSAPKYYDQVVNAFSLTRAYTALRIDTSTGERKAPSRYPGIKRWVERRSGELIEVAIGLLEAGRAEIAVNPRRTRLGQLLAVVSDYGMPTNQATLDKLKSFTESAVNPTNRESATAMVGFLGKPNYRRLLDKILHANAAALMRANILDKDSWKFIILSKLDVLLDLDPEETWNTWGETYTAYAQWLSEDLADSDNDEDLREAIEELTSIAEMLGTDLYEEIHTLEQRRHNLPEDDDYNDVKPEIRPPREAVDDSTRLDNIFASLLN